MLPAIYREFVKVTARMLNEQWQSNFFDPYVVRWLATVPKTKIKVSEMPQFVTDVCAEGGLEDIRSSVEESLDILQ